MEHRPSGRREAPRSRACHQGQLVRPSGPLIGQVGIMNQGETALVTLLQHAAQFLSRDRNPTRNYQGSITEVDEPDFPAASMPHRLRRSAGMLVWPRCETLAFAGCGHGCTVALRTLQGANRCEGRRTSTAHTCHHGGKAVRPRSCRWVSCWGGGGSLRKGCAEGAYPQVSSYVATSQATPEGPSRLEVEAVLSHPVGIQQPKGRTIVR